MVYISGQRADIVKRGDNLQPEGEFQKRPDQEWAPGERANIVKRGDNLQPEGEFQKRPDQSWAPGNISIIFRGSQIKILFVPLHCHCTVTNIYIVVCYHYLVTLTII